MKLGSEDIFFLPLTYLPRAPNLSYFDLCDESGDSLPLLNRVDNAKITGAILPLAANRALERREEHLDAALTLAPHLTAYLAGIPTRAAGTSRTFVEAVLDRTHLGVYPDQRVANVLLRDVRFKDLLGVCAKNSVVHIPLAAKPGQRRIVKLSWEQPWRPDESADRRWRHAVWIALGWRPYQLWLDRPHMGAAESQHMQVAVPQDVELVRAGMATRPPASALAEFVPPGPGGAWWTAPPDPDKDRLQPSTNERTQRSHLYIDQSPPHRIGGLWVEVRSARPGFVTLAPLTALLVAVMLGVYAWQADTIVGHSEAGAAVLLLLPALLATFLARPGEHAMARHLLRWPRRVMAVVAVLPLTAAVLLVAFHDSGTADRSLVEVLFGRGTDQAAPHLVVVGWAAASVVAAILALVLGGAWPRLRGRSGKPGD